MKTRLLGILLIVFLLTFNVNSQNEEKAYTFTKQVEVPVTPVKNQFKSGTCWSFAGIALIEAEVLRIKKEEVDLSDMFIVRHTFYEKAERFVRFHGKNNFGGGGAFHDVTHIIRKYGIVPNEAYTGLNYGTEKHEHGELDEVLESFANSIVKNKNKQLTTAWRNAINGILDAYFGKSPEKFNYKGKEYTPHSFTKYLGINPDDYIAITSFTHHPFYSQFVLELPDNWLHANAYNVTLSELEEIIDNALNKGYSVGWATDVSEKGFSWRNGIAIIPELKIEDLGGSERSRWESLTPAEREKEMYKFDKPITEKTITQENRQIAFDNFTTTDDHGMLITGIYTDQLGNKYYKVKNSWDVTNVYEGYLYASKAFVMYKTTNIMVHKNAIPKSIAKKLNL